MLPCTQGIQYNHHPFHSHLGPALHILDRHIHRTNYNADHYCIRIKAGSYPYFRFHFLSTFLLRNTNKYQIFYL